MPRLFALPIILIVGVGLAYFFRNSNIPASTAGQFNVVLISIDSLRADHMGVYGYTRDTTPNIDTFAKEAIVFDSYFSTSYLTPVSEMSVHTGLYPLRHGVINFESLLPSVIPTLAKILKSNGFATAGMGSSPEFMGHPALRAGFSQGFDTYSIYGIGMGARGDVPVREAIEWMKEKEAAREPFFFWLAVGSVHWPYGQDEPSHFSDPSYDGFLKAPISVHKESNESSSLPGEIEVTTIFNNLYGRVYDGKRYDAAGRVVSEDVGKDISYVIGRYDDGIVKTDRLLKDLLDYLSQSDVSRNTIVIIQSEHGEDFGEHGYIAHYDITDTQTHVPLIVKMPDTIPRRVGMLASGVDILPTLLDALGIERPASDGVSFYPLLSGNATTSPRDEVFMTRTPLWERVISPYESWLDDFVTEDNKTPSFDTAIRTTEWKLIHRMSRSVLKNYSWWGRLTGKPVELPEYELYNVAADPLEQHDLYDTEHQIAHSLREKLHAWESVMMRYLRVSAPAEKIQPYF